jgi:predicted secreted protein
MKKSTWVLAALCALALCLTVMAAAQEKGASVAGSWEMSMQGPQGTMTQTLTLEQTGKDIKGTLKGMRGESPVEGTIEGNKINFTVKRQTPNGERTIPYAGTVDGDNMKGTVKFGENEREWTAKRAK